MDGQKYPVPLDSPLDIRSNDMLVPVESPELQHNRQKYQGRYSANSVRCEMNGWAAGWDVWNYKYLEDVAKDNGIILKSYLLNDLPMYMLQFENEENEVVYTAIYNKKDTTFPNLKDDKFTVNINGEEIILHLDSNNVTAVWDDEVPNEVRERFKDPIFRVTNDLVFVLTLTDTATRKEFDGKVIAPSTFNNGSIVIAQFDSYTDDTSEYVWVNIETGIKVIYNEHNKTLSINNIIHTDVEPNDIKKIHKVIEAEEPVTFEMQKTTNACVAKVTAVELQNVVNVITGDTSQQKSFDYCDVSIGNTQELYAGMTKQKISVYIPVWQTIQMSSFSLPDTPLDYIKLIDIWCHGREGSEVVTLYVKQRLQRVNNAGHNDGDKWEKPDDVYYTTNKIDTGSLYGWYRIGNSTEHTLSRTIENLSTRITFTVKATVKIGDEIYRSNTIHYDQTIKGLWGNISNMVIGTKPEYSSSGSSISNNGVKLDYIQGPIYTPQWSGGTALPNFRGVSQILPAFGSINSSSEVSITNAALVTQKESGTSSNKLGRIFINCSKLRQDLFLEWDKELWELDKTVPFKITYDENSPFCKVMRESFPDFALNPAISYAIVEENYWEDGYVPDYGLFRCQINLNTSIPFVVANYIKMSDTVHTNLVPGKMFIESATDTYYADKECMSMESGSGIGDCFLNVNFTKGNAYIHKVLTSLSYNSIYNVKQDNEFFFNTGPLPLTATLFRFIVGSVFDIDGKLNTFKQVFEAFTMENTNVEWPSDLYITYTIQGSSCKDCVPVGEKYLLNYNYMLEYLKDGNNIIDGLRLVFKYNYDYKAQLPYIIDNKDSSTTVASIKNGVIEFSNDLLWNYFTRYVRYKDNAYTMSDDNEYNFVYVQTQTFKGYIKGLINSPEVAQQDDTIIYKDSVFNLNDIYNKVSEVEYTVVDTTDENLEEKTVKRQECNSNFQFLKQDWCTDTTVESFWWLDNNHILELNKYDFVVKRKLKTVNDWYGDNFEVIKTIPRDDLIPSNCNKYGVTSGAIGLFWTMSVASNTELVVRKYDLVNDITYEPVSISVMNRKLGEPLLVKDITTYANITAKTIESTSECSSFYDGTVFVLGIHCDNNFNQWAFVHNLNNNKSYTIQGYGYVAPDGSLTGGEIPVEYFFVDDDNDGGFIGTVKDLTVLSTELTECRTIQEFERIDNYGEVVGTDTQQWYLRDISGIVSHLTWDGERYTPHTLPLNNNVTTVYGSGSWAISKLSDFESKRKPLSEFMPSMFTGTIASALRSLVAGITIGVINYITPRISSGIYLQQTAGSYSYVHYNNSDVRHQTDVYDENVINDTWKREQVTSIESHPQNADWGANLKDALKTDEFSFNLHSARQSCTINESLADLFFNIAGIDTDSIKFDNAVLSVNAVLQSVVTGSVAPIISLFASLNTLTADSNTITPKGLLPTCNSAVINMLYLDMFYSTSRGQQVCAGPGYVNHNFVAQAVAQSVTSLQFEITQLTSFYMLLANILQSLRSRAFGLETAVKALECVIPACASAPFGAGIAIALGMAAAAKGVEVGLNLVRLQIDIVEEIMESFDVKQIKTSISSLLSKHTINIEAKHKYGSKSECFMWPCFDVNNDNNYVQNEAVGAELINTPFTITIPMSYDKSNNITPVKNVGVVESVNMTISTLLSKVQETIIKELNGTCDLYNSACVGKSKKEQLPDDMAYIIGASILLPQEPYKNENIGEGDPTFSLPVIQDYCLSKNWQLGITAQGNNNIVWVSCKDTKVIDGRYSNILVTNTYCCVASSYTAIEIKRGIQQRYIRPFLVTPDALGWNNTGFNCGYDKKMYHGFDGQGYRTVSWLGTTGLGKNRLVYQYAFICNDRFKRSNILRPNQVLGNFIDEPVSSFITYDTDELYTSMALQTDNNVLSSPKGEFKNDRRYSLPIFTEPVNTLPAAVKTYSSYCLQVNSGVTTITTDIRNAQSNYKIPESVDFTIGNSKYRATREYICKVLDNAELGTTAVENIVPSLGLTYIGSTPYEAYFYSAATRQYYVFNGGTSLEVADTIERFDDVLYGKYDFVNQSVVLPCVHNPVRIDKYDEDKVIVPCLKEGKFIGEIWPPLDTIYNKTSWFKTYSLPSGIVYQGPNRCIINRYIISPYMYKSIIENLHKWDGVNVEAYHPFRQYPEIFQTVLKQVENGVRGWTHNPFLLVTSPLGISTDVDCMYEWEIVFNWTVEMERLYNDNNYANVTVIGETMAEGGKVFSRPVHIYLYKKLFINSNNFGYYTFRYQSKGGMGNRERLHIWCDSYIAISSIQVNVKQMTESRQSQLTIAEDIKNMTVM